LIVVSHDRDFLKGLANRTVEFRDKKLYEYLGDVNYFLEKRQMENMREVEMKTVTSPSVPQSKTAYNGDKDMKKIERTIQNSEKRISDFEKQVAEIEKEMAKDNFYSRSDSQKVLDKYNGIKKELEVEMEKWEMATMELES
jgi:ATP-binding cassette, subfamily F, member 3